VIGLFHGEKDRENRETLIAEYGVWEYGVWYESALLPRYQPEEPLIETFPCSSIAGSLLCHVSVSRWCDASNLDPFRPDRKKRCRRLSANGAGKLVELLNKHLEGGWVEGKLTPAVHACADCHGKNNVGSAMVKMNCAACHQLPSKHP